MTQSELTNVFARKSRSKKDANVMVKCFFDEIKDALKVGRRVEFRGFGSFFLRKRSSRVARDPRTGEELNIPEKYVPFFRSGKEVKKVIN